MQSCVSLAPCRCACRSHVHARLLPPPLHPPQKQAARVVLGQFKKQHKRRDPNLRTWEEGGHRMQVLAVGSQADMLAHQAAARGLALPTHTYATLSKEQGRGQRSVMAIGPAPAELLDQVGGWWCGDGDWEECSEVGRMADGTHTAPPCRAAGPGGGAEVELRPNHTRLLLASPLQVTAKLPELA